MAPCLPLRQRLKTKDRYRESYSDNGGLLQFVGLLAALTLVTVLAPLK